MASSKVGLLLGASVAALAAFFMLDKKAGAASAAPPGFVPPPGAQTRVLAPGAANPLPFSVTSTSWRLPGDLGMTTMLYKTGSPTDFAVVMKPDAAGQQTGVLAVGTSQTSGLLAQAAVAGF